MKRSILLSLIALGVLSGCASTNDGTQISSSANALEPSVLTLGTYDGIMPCADCDGIATSLSLNADGTYDLTTIYQNSINDVAKDELTYTNSGVYESNGDMVKVITPSSGDVLVFKVLDNKSLLRVAEDGTEPMPELYDNYILKRAK